MSRFTPSRFASLFPRGMARVQLLLGGWTLLVLVVLYLPIVVLIVFSTNDSETNTKWMGFTAKWYRLLWSEDPVLLKSVPRRVTAELPQVMRSLKNSLFIAAVSTTISTALGTAGAWLIYRYRYPFGRLLSTLVAVPMIVPEIIMGVSLLVFFAVAARFGNPLAEAAGLGPGMFSRGFTTVILSHVTFCFPFVLITVQARLAGMDPALEEAALDLSATPWQAFWWVVVPYLWPGIVGGALMAFTLSIDDFVVTHFTYGPVAETFPIRVYGSVKRPNPMLGVVSSLLVVGTAVLVVVSEMIKRVNRSRV